MLKNGINCIKFYWFGIFCSSIMGIVVSTFFTITEFYFLREIFTPG